MKTVFYMMLTILLGFQVSCEIEMKSSKDDSSKQEASDDSEAITEESEQEITEEIEDALDPDYFNEQLMPETTLNVDFLGDPALFNLLDSNDEPRILSELATEVDLALVNSNGDIIASIVVATKTDRKGVWLSEEFYDSVVIGINGFPFDAFQVRVDKPLRDEVYLRLEGWEEDEANKTVFLMKSLNSLYALVEEKQAEDDAYWAEQKARSEDVVVDEETTDSGTPQCNKQSPEELLNDNMLACYKDNRLFDPYASKCSSIGTEYFLHKMESIEDVANAMTENKKDALYCEWEDIHFLKNNYFNEYEGQIVEYPTKLLGCAEVVKNEVHYLVFQYYYWSCDTVAKGETKIYTSCLIKEKDGSNTVKTWGDCLK